MVGGEANGGTNVYEDVALARYHPDGSLDTSFATAGKLRMEFARGHGSVYDLAIQPDGKILVVGGAEGDFFLARFNSNGSLDTSFGSGGTRQIDNSLMGYGIGADVQLLADGRFVVSTYFNPAPVFVVARFNADGSFDTTFNGNGLQQIGFGTTYAIPTSLDVQPDGKVVVAGYAYDESGISPRQNMAATRLNTDGSIDTTFGTNGRFTYDFAGYRDEANDVVIRGDGSIVLVGTLADPIGTNNTGYAMGLVGLTPDGNLDTAFATNGAYFGPPMPGIFEEIHVGTLDDQDRLVAVVGYYDDIRVSRFRLDSTGRTAQASISVTDDETSGPPLTVTIDRSQIYEYSGNGAANVTITRPDSVGSLTVTLTSSDTSEVQIQSSAVIPGGQTSVVVPLNAINDDLLDGTQTVSLTASADGYSDGSDSIDVLDIENLTFAIDKDSIAIGGESATATVTRLNTNVDDPITVNVQFENATDLIVPAQVVIPAGQQSVDFPITSADNGIVEGNRTIQVVVSSPGYFNAFDTLEVREDGVIGVDSVADGHATDGWPLGSFDSVAMPQYSIETRINSQLERRGIFEFDVSAIGGTLDAVSLTLKTSGLSTSQGVGPTIAVFGYIGDGALNPADAEAGQKIGEIEIPGDGTGLRRFGVPLDVAFIQSAIDAHQFIGLSTRIASGSSLSVVSSRNTFQHESNHPRLQFSLTSDPVLEARDDTVTTDEDNAVAIEVLLNDSGSGLTVVSATSPTHGSAAVNQNGTVTYTPDVNYFGTDSFVYTVSDADGNLDTAIVNVTVAPQNDRPTAVADAVTTNEDSAIVIDLLANDFDTDGDSLSLGVVTQPQIGTVTINNDHTVTYTPPANYHGTQIFTYLNTDGSLSSNRVFVTVTVSPVNDGPNAADDAVTTDEDNSVTISVLGNDSDIDGDTLTVSAVTNPGNGTATINQGGSITYTPNANFNGADSFDYTISDGNGGSDTATVNIVVNAANDAPNAVNDAATTDEDNAVTISVLGNDSDIDGDTLSVTAATNPANGSVTVNADGSITYTPNANFNGTDSFDYTISDGNGGSDTATVNVDVTPVNDAPEVVDAVFALEENAADGTEIGAISASDIEGDDLVFAISGADAAAFAIASQTGVLTVVDSALLDFETQSRFDFVVEVTDANGASTTASVRIDLSDVLEVAIDVVPGDPDNNIDLGSKEIEVAILGSAGFDPLTMLDLGSVRLSATGSTTSAGIASHRKHGLKIEQRDVNGDGILDLVAKFETSATGLQASDTSVRLVGSHLPQYGGESFSVDQAVAVTGGSGGGGKGGGNGGGKGKNK